MPDPEPGAGLALVRVRAAAVGHVDLDIMRGGFIRHPPLPYVPGVEGSGHVLRSERFPEGEAVWFRGAGLGTVADGTWAELASVREDALMPVPAGVTLPVAACFFSAATSAYVALYDVGEVQPGERVAVRGAAGAVGSLAVQLARHAGVQDVVGIVSSPDRADDVPGGVDVVAGGCAEVAARLAADAEGVDLLVDTVGGPGLTDLVEAVRPGGRIVLVGYTAGTRTELDLSRLMQRDVRLLPLNMIRRERAARVLAADLLRQLADGALTLRVTTFPLEDVARAIELLSTGRANGRVALEP